MKKLFLMAALMLVTVAGFAQDGKSLYRKYCDTEGVSAVYISPAMFKLIGKLPDMEVGGEGVNLGKAIEEFKGFYLISTDDKSLRKQLREDVYKIIDKNDYEMLLEAKDSGDAVKMYILDKGKYVSSLIFLATENDETAFICLEGMIKKEVLQKLLEKMDY